MGIDLLQTKNVKRGQMVEAEAEAKPSRPEPNVQRQDRGQKLKYQY